MSSINIFEAKPTDLNSAVDKSQLHGKREKNGQRRESNQALRVKCKSAIQRANGQPLLCKL